MKNFMGRVLSTVVGNFFTISIFALCLVVIGFFSLFSSKNTVKKVKSDSVLVIDFKDKVMESEMDKEWSLFNLDDEYTAYLLDIVNAIKAAATDDNIKGIVLKTDQFSGGLTQAEDIRNALLEFKKSRKFVYAYGNSMSQSAYYINTVASEIYLNPMGQIALQGIGTQVLFYKNAGDKYGVDFQIIRHGDFKGAVEPFFRSSLSDANKLQLSTIFNDFWGDVSTKMANQRKVDLNSFNQLTDSLVAFIPEQAVKSKLFDKMMQETDFDKMVAKKIGIDTNDANWQKDFYKQIISLNDYSFGISRKEGKEKIAILYASGNIVDGKGFEGIAGDTYVKAIQDITADESIKAVVLRVNSPGGSANASESILNELKKLKLKKPLIVSFGDYAASGGYFIAMAGNRIFAENNTLTGSIGVFGMIPNIEKLANNLGVTSETVQTNSNALTMKTINQPLSIQAKTVLQRSVENTYKIFVNHVSDNRKMTFDAVDKIGGGRIWSGTRAKQLGLIDEIGDLQAAINYAVKTVKLEDYGIVSYPQKEQNLNEFLKKYQVSAVKASIKETIGEDDFQLLQEIKAVKNEKGIQLLNPYKVVF